MKSLALLILLLTALSSTCWAQPSASTIKSKVARHRAEVQRRLAKSRSQTAETERALEKQKEAMKGRVPSGKVDWEANEKLNKKLAPIKEYYRKRKRIVIAKEAKQAPTKEDLAVVLIKAKRFFAAYKKNETAHSLHRQEIARLKARYKDYAAKISISLTEDSIESSEWNLGSEARSSRFYLEALADDALKIARSPTAATPKYVRSPVRTRTNDPIEPFGYRQSWAYLKWDKEVGYTRADAIRFAYCVAQLGEAFEQVVGGETEPWRERQKKAAMIAKNCRVSLALDSW